MIERAEREHPERNMGVRKQARDRAEAAVAPADHDGVDLSALGLLESRLGGRVQVITLDELDSGDDAMLREGGR